MAIGVTILLQYLLEYFQYLDAIENTRAHVYTRVGIAYLLISNTYYRYTVYRYTYS